MKLKPVVASLVMLGLMAPAFAKSGLATQQAVIDQNSAASPVSIEGWFNRISVGGIGSIVGIAGNRYPAGSFKNTSNSSDLYVDNLNLLVNADLSKWSKATLNMAYLGAPGINSLGTTTTASHNISVDEAYITIANLAKSPFYFVAGKKYVPFGDYVDAYTPYQIMSPAQMLAQTNATTAIVGATTDFGFYGNLFALKGNTSPVGSTTGNIRNFGAKIGYYNHLDAFGTPNTHINVALSYINNLWDNQAATKYFTASNGYPAIDPIGGVSLHGDLAYKAFSMSANYVTAVKNMVATYSQNTGSNSRFWAADVNADYAFKTLDLDSHLGAGIQLTGNGAWLADSKKFSANSASYIVPKWRLVGEYKINLFKNTDLGLTVAHGKSYDFVGINTQPSGSLNTTVGLARLMVQL